MGQSDRRDDGNVYVVGRPIMFAVWALTLWGTVTGVRLVWIFATGDPSKALRIARLSTVWVPIVVAVVMWIALVVAVRRFRKYGEP